MSVIGINVAVVFVVVIVVVRHVAPTAPHPRLEPRDALAEPDAGADVVVVVAVVSFSVVGGIKAALTTPACAAAKQHGENASATQCWMHCKQANKQ